MAGRFRLPARSAAWAVVASVSFHPFGAELAAEPATASPATKRSGYALDAEQCGDGALSFPKLRIGMRAGYCVGLVASKDDGLTLPRSIVQIPDSNMFVVADMGGWSARQGRLLL